MTSAKPIQLSKVWTTCFSGGKLREVEIQVLIRNGIPKFDIIGLPQNMIREGKDRIYATLASLGIELPAQKILVNLNPGDIPKEGSHFDLPIIVGIFKCLGLLPHSTEKDFYWGEVQLDGSIHQMNDLLSHLFFANRHHPKSFYFGGQHELWRSLGSYMSAEGYPLHHTHEIFDYQQASGKQKKSYKDLEEKILHLWATQKKDFAWNHLKASQNQLLFWCLTALGRHHVLLEGSPGVGKSSWCYAFRDILFPKLHTDWSEIFQFQNTSEASFEIQDLMKSPFEMPHHSASAAAIIGGGNAQIVIGAMSRAHRGVLFLDELPEFSRDVLEALREPLENKSISIARQGRIRRLPADIQLIAAMNPCPCGNAGSKKICMCSTQQFWKYKSRISEPLRDRFHLKAWWTFENEKRNEGGIREYQVQQIRRKMISIHTQAMPQLGDLEPPTELNPRRQKIWLELLISWCRWHGVSKVSKQDASHLNNFLTEMENPNDTSRSITKG